MNNGGEHQAVSTDKEEEHNGQLVEVVSRDADAFWELWCKAHGLCLSASVVDDLACNADGIKDERSDEAKQDTEEEFLEQEHAEVKGSIGELICGARAPDDRINERSEGDGERHFDGLRRGFSAKVRRELYDGEQASGDQRPE